MNFDAGTLTPPRPIRPARKSFRAQRAKPGSPFAAHGESLLWLTGGALVIALAMIIGLLTTVAYQGFSTFWPQPLLEVKTIYLLVFFG
jgi:hypothetical protein